MAGISKTVRPKRSSNRTVLPPGFGLTAGRGTPTALGSGSGVYTTDYQYIGTHEAVDNDTILADDFTRGYVVSGGGSFYSYTADDVIPFLGSNNIGTLSGYYNPGVMFWLGTIANGRPSPTPARAVVNLGSGFWAMTSGQLNTLNGAGSNLNTANMADHNVKYPTNEAWIRFYRKMSPDYVVGAEKMLTLNSTVAGSGGISIGGAGSGGGTGAAWTMCPVYDCNTTGEVYYYRQNQGGPLVITTPGRWQFCEFHFKMNTPGVKNGIWEMWLDDCGNGTLPVNPVGSPTLRAAHYTVEWQGPSDNKLLRSIWMENWSNPVSQGSYVYTMLLNVNRAHALGFSTILP